MTHQVYAEYDAKRNQLLALMAEFEYWSQESYRLYHQLLYATGERKLTPRTWPSFAKTHTHDDPEWQKWDFSPDQLSLGRFFGSKLWLRTFTKLAESAYGLLTEMESLTRRLSLPPEIIVRLPPYPGRHGFVLLLYQTAAAYGRERLDVDT